MQICPIRKYRDTYLTILRLLEQVETLTIVRLLLHFYLTVRIFEPISSLLIANNTKETKR